MELNELTYGVWITILIIALIIAVSIAWWSKVKGVPKTKINYLFSILFTGIMLVGFIVLFIISGFSPILIIPLIFFVIGIAMIIVAKNNL